MSKHQISIVGLAQTQTSQILRTHSDIHITQAYRTREQKQTERENREYLRIQQ